MDVVVAVAFLRVFDAAETEATAVADVLAEGDGHEGVVGSGVAVERAILARAVVVAAEVFLVGCRVCLADVGRKNYIFRDCVTCVKRGDCLLACPDIEAKCLMPAAIQGCIVNRYPACYEPGWTRRWLVRY